MSHMNGVHSHEMMTELIIATSYYSIHIFLYIILSYRIQKIKIKTLTENVKTHIKS